VLLHVGIDRQAAVSLQESRRMPYNDPNNQTTDETAHLLTQLTRIGCAIDKELSLINERMTWLVVSESFMFSAYTMAIANHDKALVLNTLVFLMPIVGLLLALLVYPGLLAAHFTAKWLKEERHLFELRLPKGLQVKLLAPRRAHVLGSVPAFVIPVMLVTVWGVIIWWK
jgi:ABC-type uncharacterized transport system fused permease/ATPase subunit